MNTFRGGFADFSAVLTGGDESLLQGAAKVASVDVKDEQLNGHLQTPDFFDAARYPEIAFRATDLRRLDGDRVAGSGELTLKGVTKSVPLALEINGFGPDAYGGTRAGFTATAEINRQDFGVNWNAAMETGGVVVSDSAAAASSVTAETGTPAACARSTHSACRPAAGRRRSANRDRRSATAARPTRRHN